MKKIKLSKWKLFNHFLIPAAIITVPLLLFSYHYWEIEIAKTYTGVRTLTELFSINYFSLSVGTIGLIIKYKRLFYKEIKGEISEELLQTAIRRFKKEYSLTTISKVDNKYMLRSHNMNTNYGKLITIIHEDNKILFNEICYPEFGWNGFSLGIIKKELRTFLRHINETGKGNKYSKQKHFTDNQWGLKMIVIRLFLYPLSVFLICFDLYNLAYGGNYLLSIITLVISATYLLSDLYMIFKKKKKAVNNIYSK